jgi:hypothetical protein
MGGLSTDSSSYDWTPSKSVTKKSARDYAADDNRVYAVEPGKGASPLGKDIQTDGKYVNIIMVDGTGSMQKEPGRFFSKCPALYHESNAIVQGYDLKDMQKLSQPIPDMLNVSFFGIGDAFMDEYPLQVTDFVKRDGLDDAIKSIYPEGGGGPFGEESYELGAFYAVNHCKTPNCDKPLCVIFGDEAFYDKIKPRHIKKIIGDDVPAELDSFEVLGKLKEKFDTYVLQPELSSDAATYKTIHDKWTKVLGPQRVIVLNSVERAVDCIIGLNGISSGRWNEAKEMLERRQRKDQVDEVVKALHPVLSAKI